MHLYNSTTLQDAERLGQLAMQFRGTQADAERSEIASAYGATVDQLIKSGTWHEMPPPEDQLPDRWMPKAFFEYWAQNKVIP